MRRVISSLLFSAALLCFGTASATATTITSSTFSSWKSNLSSAPTEADFSPIGYKNYNTSSGLTLSSFTFTGPDGANWALTGTTFSGLKSLEGGSDGNAAINVALPGAGENAVLLSLASTGGAPVTVDLSDGETFTLTSNGLFGLSISHPITWLTVATSAGSQAVIDDFYYGISSLAQDPTGSGAGTGNGDEVEPVPESATLLLISGGLLMLLGAHRRSHVPATAAAV